VFFVKISADVNLLLLKDEAARHVSKILLCIPGTIYALVFMTNGNKLSLAKKNFQNYLKRRDDAKLSSSGKVQESPGMSNGTATLETSS